MKIPLLQTSTHNKNGLNYQNYNAREYKFKILLSLRYLVIMWISYTTLKLIATDKHLIF